MDSDNKKLSQLTQITSLNDSDFFVVSIDVPSAPKTRGIKKTSVYNGGWFPVGWASPTRTGATTFTVAEDITGIVTQGTKLKFTDTTTKYLPVLSATYGAGVTTITCLATSDYAFVGNPSAISYSNAAKPDGWPDRFAFVPTLTKLPSYTSCGVKISGRTCHFEFSADNKTLTAGAAGSINITLPVAPLIQTYMAILINNGSGWLLVGLSLNTISVDVFKTSTLGGWTGGEAGVYIRFVVDYLY
jgi:hypothetical protein